ncbi:MAG: glycoside hydrolase family 44 protein [Ardenticatenaceae bacterium]|nr:glycoside hydrolase family 44 protein [Ardenticatenaceae bacterium]
MKKRFVWKTTIVLALFLIPILSLAAQPTANLIIYDDALAANWQNWSWDTAVAFNASSPVHAGSNAMSVTHTAAWAGLSLQSNTSFSTADYNAVTFWIHGGTTGGHQLSLKLRDGSLAIIESPIAVTTTANSWTQVEVSMSDLGLSNGTVTGIVLQEASGASQPVYYLDDVQLVEADGNGTPVPPGTGPALTIDTTTVSHTISPDIYGINFADNTFANEVGLPVSRWGGNATTRYNWKIDVSNRASDWFFMNVPDGDNDLTVTGLDEFVQANNSAGTRSIVTMPLIGWTPNRRLTNDRDCGFPQSIYPNQQAFDGNWNCGNGRFPDGTPITGNDPTLTSTAIDESWVNEWVTHLTNEFGTAANGGVPYYALDNEPMLWNSTHRDVYPDPLTYDELLARTVAYAAAIKQADPSANTLGPVLWGWTAYFYSAADVASGGSFWLNPPDRLAHGDMPLVEWYLQQLATYEQNNGTRLLDYLDLHFYPQQSGVALSTAGGDATQALRLRSTRALWDPTYVDESWINEPVELIPRMHDWVNTYYPGTKLAITEYNWGGLEHINGALAQADVLGIFGQQQVDLATLWAPPANSDPGAFAFRMYLNYDGSGSAFGNLSLPASSSNVDQLSVFAARRSSDLALTIMVVNKSGQPLTSNITLNGFVGGTAEIYQYASSNLSQITQQPTVVVPADGFSATFPADSITLFEIANGDVTQTFLPLVNK